MEAFCKVPYWQNSGAEKGAWIREGNSPVHAPLYKHKCYSMTIIGLMVDPFFESSKAFSISLKE